MIKGGGSIHAQNVADAYTLNNTSNPPAAANPTQGIGLMGPQMVGNGGKSMKKNMHNSNFNQSKYISGNISTQQNQSQSPASQTFFKENKKTNNTNSLIGKKGWPLKKNKNANNNQNMFVSPYSKNPK
jgi:hypothetical protein